MDENADFPDVEDKTDILIPGNKKPHVVSGTVKIYFTVRKSGKVKAQINIKDNIASRAKEIFEQGEELYLIMNADERSIRIESLPINLKK